MTTEEIYDFIRNAVRMKRSPAQIIQELIDAGNLTEESARAFITNVLTDQGTPQTIEQYTQEVADIDAGNIPGIPNFNPVQQGSPQGFDVMGGLQGPLGGTLPQTGISNIFDQFVSLSPWGRSPALRRGAEAREQEMQLQFLLQQPQAQDKLAAFRNFLTGGAVETGEALQSRLANLVRSVTARPGTTSGSGPESVYRQTYGDNLPLLFNTLALPQLQQIAPYFRPALQRSLQEQRFGQFPSATASDVARWFGYATPGPVPQAVEEEEPQRFENVVAQAVPQDPNLFSKFTNWTGTPA